MSKLRNHPFTLDAIAVIVLVLLWLLFFWRLFTPIEADQVSLLSGDFSGQFLAFGAYQYERLAAGEIPLWNPYNNGGLPFIADTQAAVFYPPRLVTIGLSALSGGWSYNALQMEMVFHILVYTLLMYILVRRMTIGSGYSSVLGALVAAIIAGYSGYMAGYPPLQLALLEAGIWLPLALLGVLEATRHLPIRPSWLVLGGLALGLSWMAGHPQTSWFATYLLVAYLGWRVFLHPGPSWRGKWTWFIGGTTLIGAITFGLTAVHLLPGVEYLARTMRTDFTFDAKSGGFPFQDIAQFVFPGVVSLWSPLYVGVTGLVLAVISLAGKERDRLFWAAAALVALGSSLGGNSVVFHALYNVLPGLRFFRGQERAAYLVANSLAILAGLGVVTLFTLQSQDFLRRTRRGLLILFFICAVSAGAVFVVWMGNRPAYDAVIAPVMFSTAIAGVLLLLPVVVTSPRPWHGILLVALVVFELVTVNIDNTNYEPIPAGQQAIMTPPPLVRQVQADNDIPFRVDGGLVGGHIGIYGHGNTGSLYGVQDIRGISPLFLDGAHAIIQRELPAEVAWELFTVRYVFTEAEALPIASEIVGTDQNQGHTIHLHHLENPRPFALLLYDYEVVDSDEFARALLADPNFDERATIILNQPPALTITAAPPETAQVTIIDFAPEHMTLLVNTPENALLSVALVDYPGWQARINGEPAETIRAYGALTALPIPAGEHTVTFTYEPTTFRVGAVLSLFTWAALGILGAVLLFRNRKGNAGN